MPEAGIKGAFSSSLGKAVASLVGRSDRLPDAPFLLLKVEKQPRREHSARNMHVQPNKILATLTRLTSLKSQLLTGPGRTTTTIPRENLGLTMILAMYSTCFW